MQSRLEQRDERAAGAIAEQGDADDHVREVVPLGDRKDAHQGNLEGDAGGPDESDRECQAIPPGVTLVCGGGYHGKSTLLHILGTLDRPDSGTLEFQGEDVFLFNDFKLAQFRNRTIGFVFQFHHLLPEFSALENAMMPALISGFDKPDASKAAEEILVRVGLQDRLHLRVGKLSGGEQQRVAIARALVHDPVLVLADEPTASLDTERAFQVVETLANLETLVIGPVHRLTRERDPKVALYAPKREIDQQLAAQVVTFIHNLRKSSLHKPPGIAESLDWAKTLLLMNEGNITDEIVQNTIGCVLKHKDDIEFVRNKAVQEFLVPID